mgnify:CR=1 FL=1
MVFGFGGVILQVEKLHSSVFVIMDEFPVVGTDGAGEAVVHVPGIVGVVEKNRPAFQAGALREKRDKAFTVEGLFAGLEAGDLEEGRGVVDVLDIDLRSYFVKNVSIRFSCASSKSQQNLNVNLCSFVDSVRYCLNVFMFVLY